jgi:predicted secreted protein
MKFQKIISTTACFVLATMLLVSCTTAKHSSASGAGIKTSAMLLLTSAESNKDITVSKGQKIQLTLRNPGDGGYTFNEPVFNKSLLKLDSHVHNPPAQNAMMGNFGEDVWIFSATAEGSSELTITAGQPWAGGSKSTSFSAKLMIK